MGIVGRACRLIAATAILGRPDARACPEPSSPPRGMIAGVHRVGVSEFSGSPTRPADRQSALAAAAAAREAGRDLEVAGVFVARRRRDLADRAEAAHDVCLRLGGGARAGRDGQDGIESVEQMRV
jgi:hypothetical protein